MTEQMRKQYTSEFKVEAVELVTKQGYTIAETARSLGIRPNLLGWWRQEYNQVRPHSALGYRPPAPTAILTGATT